MLPGRLPRRLPRRLAMAMRPRRLPRCLPRRLAMAMLPGRLPRRLQRCMPQRLPRRLAMAMQAPRLPRRLQLRLPQRLPRRLAMAMAMLPRRLVAMANRMAETTPNRAAAVLRSFSSSFGPTSSLRLNTGRGRSRAVNWPLGYRRCLLRMFKLVLRRAAAEPSRERLGRSLLWRYCLAHH